MICGLISNNEFYFDIKIKAMGKNGGSTVCNQQKIPS